MAHRPLEQLASLSDGALPFRDNVDHVRHGVTYTSRTPAANCFAIHHGPYP
jgi:hypothetical protein